ncbi:MAG TPA: GTPase ObgE [Planctomycetota bacterium]|nr:GTPase ObgE [Planctomycetota bacterium]
MFIDETQIKVKAGDGGNGAVAFLRLKFMPWGGPAGGDGGKGGDIVFEATRNIDTLLPLYRRRRIAAKDGGKGEGKNCSGRGADDVVVQVPPGTIIRDEKSGEIICDLTEPGQRVIAAKGGKGGRGNQHFATSTHQTPRKAEKGEPGEERELHLELKLIADAGLIGLPNAGKSTLLSRISAARPKIAAYPFTTKQPQLGIVDSGDFRQVVVADLPGLIEGAHAGAGLGDEFLKHVERTSYLVHVIDAAPPDESDPVENFHLIENELKQYSKALYERPRLIVANKMDVDGARENAALLRKALKRPVLEISAATGEGIKEFIKTLMDDVTARKDNSKFKIQNSK